MFRRPDEELFNIEYTCDTSKQKSEIRIRANRIEMDEHDENRVEVWLDDQGTDLIVEGKITRIYVVNEQGEEYNMFVAK